MSDATAGVAEMVRVARRTVTSCVWDYAGEMTMLRAFWDAARELDPNAPDEGRTMRYWSPFPTCIAPSGAYCASLDPHHQAALRKACLRRLGSPKGPFSLSARAWFVRGATA